MTTTLRDFLDAREAAIKEQLKALRAEQAEIKLARQALAGGASDSSTSQNQSNLTIKEMVRTILDGAPMGMTAQDILRAIKDDYGKDVERTSLSPQLSRLKGDNEVCLEGDSWYSLRHWVAELRHGQAEQSDDGNDDEFSGEWEDEESKPF